jgi:hypothetical protein
MLKHYQDAKARLLNFNNLLQQPQPQQPLAQQDPATAALLPLSVGAGGPADEHTLLLLNRRHVVPASGFAPAGPAKPAVPGGQQHHQQLFGLGGPQDPEAPRREVQLRPDEDGAPLNGSKRRRRAAGGLPLRWLAAVYVALNILSTCGIVFANKLVLTTYGFSFPVALTLLHALFTTGGMELMCRGGLFARKAAPLAQTLPVSLAYVGSIMLSNWSIHLNTVGGGDSCCL